MDVKISQKNVLHNKNLQEDFSPLAQGQASVHATIVSVPVFSVSLAEEYHLLAIKQLAEQYKHELGFVNRETLRKAIGSGLVLVASVFSEQPSQELAGMVHFYVRRDSVVTLYSIVVAQEYQRKGLGSTLFNSLAQLTQSLGKGQIRLKCPAELPANLFYEQLGFELAIVEPGKHRPLNVWTYTVPSITETT